MFVSISCWYPFLILVLFLVSQMEMPKLLGGAKFGLFILQVPYYSILGSSWIAFLNLNNQDTFFALITAARMQLSWILFIVPESDGSWTGSHFWALNSMDTFSVWIPTPQIHFCFQHSGWMLVLPWARLLHLHYLDYWVVLLFQPGHQNAGGQFSNVSISEWCHLKDQHKMQKGHTPEWTLGAW